MSYLDYFCELLKNKFLQTGYIQEDEIVGFKLKEMSKNFYQEMSDKTKEEYKNGDGNELEDGKMNMIRSSSAMIYNLLGNDSVTINTNKLFPSGTYEKYFEKKLKTVKRSGKKANLDAWLHKEDCDIFIESKCMEWIQGGKSTLNKAYTENVSRYYYQSSAEIFRKASTEIELSQYDSSQMFRHTLAIYNYLKEFKITDKKIVLLNVVWEPSISEVDEKIRETFKLQLELEQKQYGIFYEKMKPVINIIKQETKNDFDIRYLSVKDFCSLIKYTNNKQAKFIQRYL